MVPWRQPLPRMIRLVTPWGEECQERISRTAGSEKSFPLTSSQAISQLFGGPYQEHVRDLTKCGQGGKSAPGTNASLCRQQGLGEASSLRRDCEQGGATVGMLPQVDFLMICFISGTSYNA